VRGTIKSLLSRASRTWLGKNAIHAALAADVRAERFSQVARWPTAVKGFEDLAFLFTSSQLNHGIASLRFDEAALLFGLVRELGPASIAEIGRFKGGSTFVIATAKDPGATLFSLDLHVAYRDDLQGPDLDHELEAALVRFGLDQGVRLVVGDSRVIDLPAGPLDLLFVDGDHSYSGVKADVARWGPLLRPGGHLLLHDAVDTGGYGNVYPGISEAAAELDEEAEYSRAGGAGTIAHFVRTGG
jgi:predicted O-methyltransferase YrrM